MTAPRPKISVCVTCYNYADYVGPAIESAINQTYPNLEIIVIDDGSTDGSPEVISRYADRVTVIRQKNQGHVPTFNRGFRESRGDIVIFLDADDLLTPTMAEEVARVWRPDCVKVQCELEIIDAAGELLGRRFCNFPEGYDSDAVRREFGRLGSYTWPLTSGNAYSRWFLQRVMPLKVTIAPDGLLNTIAPLFGDILTIAEPLACYRLHGANMSAMPQEISINLAEQLRLAQRIALRYSEVAALRQHAAKLGINLPPGNILDHEITFINYRLMARKLKVDYEEARRDSTTQLWWSALKLMRFKALPLRQKLTHLVWMTVLGLTPSGRPASFLINMRFNRASYLQPIRKVLRKDIRVGGTENAAG